MDRRATWRETDGLQGGPGAWPATCSCTREPTRGPRAVFTMDITTECRLAGALAERMRNEAADLTHRWLERIVARVEMDPRAIFPTDDLLDHAPLLIERIAEYLGDPTDEITADAPMIGHALELGALRYNQGFD